MNNSKKPPAAGSSAEPKAETTPRADVGYGKPPAHTRFKPGQSGNAKGRPPAVPSAAASIEQSLCKPVTIHIGGRRVKVSAFVAKIVQCAVRGERADLEFIRGLIRNVGLPPAEPEAAAEPVAGGVLVVPGETPHAYCLWEDLFDDEGQPRQWG